MKCLACHSLVDSFSLKTPFLISLKMSQWRWNFHDANPKLHDANPKPRSCCHGRCQGLLAIYDSSGPIVHRKIGPIKTSTLSTAKVSLAHCKTLPIISGFSSSSQYLFLIKPIIKLGNFFLSKSIIKFWIPSLIISGLVLYENLDTLKAIMGKTCTYDKIFDLLEYNIKEARGSYAANGKDKLLVFAARRLADCFHRYSYSLEL